MAAPARKEVVAARETGARATAAAFCTRWDGQP